MIVFVSWIDPHDGSLSRGVEWAPGHFEEEGAPVIGDTIVEAFEDGVDACEVVERYMYFVEGNEEAWHLVLKRVDLKPGREQALRLRKVIEGVNAFQIDLATLQKLTD